MGMFDTIHTPAGCGQAKCFGRTLADFHIGDSVKLYRSLTAEEHDAVYAELVAALSDEGLTGSDLHIAMAADPRSDVLFSGEEVPFTEYDVRMAHGGGFVHVRGGVIIGWDGVFDPEVPRFDSYGRPLWVSGVVGEEVPLDAELCADCRGETFVGLALVE